MWACSTPIASPARFETSESGVFLPRASVLLQKGRNPRAQSWETQRNSLIGNWMGRHCEWRRELTANLQLPYVDFTVEIPPSHHVLVFCTQSYIMKISMIEKSFIQNKQTNIRVDASHPDAKTNTIRDFPGGPVANIPRSQCRRPGFNSWWGN